MSPYEIFFIGVSRGMALRDRAGGRVGDLLEPQLAASGNCIVKDASCRLNFGAHSIDL